MLTRQPRLSARLLLQYPNNGRTGCRECMVGWAGRGGFCSQCHPGYAPNALKSECQACPYGKYMANTLSLDERGRCASCDPGFEPNAATAALRCDLCAEGKYSTAGVECRPCDDPVTEEVNHQRTGARSAAWVCAALGHRLFLCLAS